MRGSVFDARFNPPAHRAALPEPALRLGRRGTRGDEVLKHAHKWLCTDGVLIFLVPELIFLYERYRSWIGQHFYDVRIVRGTKEEYPGLRAGRVLREERKERHETGAVGSPPILISRT